MSAIINNKKGFTLTELLVSLAISGVIMAGVYSVFSSQQRSYVAQEQITEVQQNLRASMLILSRNVRMASFGFGPDGISYHDGAGIAHISGITGFNTNPDRIDIVYADNSVSANITIPMPVSSAELNVDGTAGFADGDLVIITDGINGSLLEITTVQPVALKLQHNPAVDNINPPGGQNIFPPGGYGPGSKVYKIKYYSFDVSFADPAHPTLRLDRDGPLGGATYQPLARNIEDLQVVYIYNDDHEDNAPDNSDANTSNDSSDIRAVRINVLARTDKTGLKSGDGRPALEDHGCGESDHYERRLLTTTIKVRNLGL